MSSCERRIVGARRIVDHTCLLQYRRDVGWRHPRRYSSVSHWPAKSRHRNGARILSSSSHVARGTDEHCLSGSACISLMTSVDVTARKNIKALNRRALLWTVQKGQFSRGYSYRTGMQAPLPATTVTGSQRELLSKVSFEDDRLPDIIALVISGGSRGGNGAIIERFFNVRFLTSFQSYFGIHLLFISAKVLTDWCL